MFYEYKNYCLYQTNEDGFVKYLKLINDHVYLV